MSSGKFLFLSLNSNRFFPLISHFCNNQYNNKIQESLRIVYIDAYLGMTLGYRQFLPMANFYISTLSFKASLYSLGINRSSCFEDVIVFSFPLYCGLSVGFLSKHSAMWYYQEASETFEKGATYEGFTWWMIWWRLEVCLAIWLSYVRRHSSKAHVWSTGPHHTHSACVFPSPQNWV